MKWFSNLKIKVKLIFCFIILADLIGITGFIGINNMRIINNRGHEMYVNNFLPAQKLEIIHKSILRIRTNYFLMVYERDISKFQDRVDEINSLVERNNRIIEEYETTIETQQERDLFEKFKASLIEYRRVRTEHIGMLQEGRYDEVILKIPEFASAREAVEQNIQALTDYKSQSAEKKAAENAKNFRSQSVIMIIIIIAGIILAMGLGLIIARLISKSLNQIVGAANKVADGDLDVIIDIEGKDEVGVLAQSFRKMADKLNDVMGNISSAAEQVASASKQVSDSSMALSQGATEQASSVEQLTASLEEISSQTRNNADNANEANKLAENAKFNAMQGNSQMKEMLKAMDEINDSSENISKIIKVIDEIAFQTNILALNAAVEAARAGQHGRGFAVVAEEVRNLAARSANAAKETTDMIEGSIKKVEGGTKIANETAEALNSIVGGVAKVADLVNDIAVASNEQALGISQINQGIMQVSEVIQTNSVTSEESAAASEELASQAELLKDQVERFKLRKDYKAAYSYTRGEEISSDALRMIDRINSKRSVPESFAEAAAAGSPKKIALSDREFGKY